MNEGVTHKALQLWELAHLHREGCVELNILAVVALNNARLHILATHIGRCINVRDKTNHRGVLIALRCWNCTHRVAILINRYIHHTERAHLVCQEIKQHQLLVG